MTDLIILEDDELDFIFETIGKLQIVFHPYYLLEGKFNHYDDFLKNKKEKVIILDRNIVSMIYDYFRKGELKSNDSMIMILYLLLFCNVNGLQYNVGLAMNEYADLHDNPLVVEQLNEVLTYLSEMPTMLIKNKLITGEYKFPKLNLNQNFKRYFNYKYESDYYLLSYCSVLKITLLYLKRLSTKDKIIQYLDWYYDNLTLSKYDITYAMLLFTNYPSVSAPKRIDTKDYKKVVKGCRNQAWDISYVTTINSLSHQYGDNYEIFFATNDKNLKLIFMACHFWEDSWLGIIYDRVNRTKDRNEIFYLIEEKSKERAKIIINSQYLINLSKSLEEELRELIV